MVGGITFGLVIGATQWLIVRSWIHHSKWWAVVSAIGMGIGWMAGDLTSRVNIGTASTGLVEISIMGFVYGILTGIALIWLLHGPIAAVSQEADASET